MTEIKEMTNPELQALIKARLKDIEKRNKGEEEARRLEKQMKKR